MKTSMKKAFTLIELLVVIAIISLLVSILLPSLTMAKELTKSGACMSNLRNLAVAFHMYAEEHDSYLPNLNPYHNPVPGNGMWYTNLLEPYTNTIDWTAEGWPWGMNPNGEWMHLDQGMWTCPAVTPEDVLRCTGYGVNEYHLIFYGRDPSGNLRGSLKLEDIYRSSEIFLIGDTRIYADWLGGWKTFKVLDCPVCTAWGEISGMGWAGPKCAAPRHPGGAEGRANAAFVDGHVESCDYRDMIDNRNDMFAHDGL